MEGEVVAMVPQEIAVNTNGPGNPQEATDVVIDVKNPALEETPVETNGSCEVEGAKEASVLSTTDQPISLTLNSSEKATTTTQVIPVCSSLPTSILDQPIESVQDSTIQSIAEEHDKNDQPITVVQDVNDQCGVGLPVAGGSQGVAEQANEEPPVSTVQSASADQSVTSQLMEVDQVVGPEAGEIPTTEEQIVPAVQVENNYSIVPQDGSAVSGLVDGQFILEDQSKTDEVMEIDESENAQCVVEQKDDDSQPATMEQLEVKQVVKGQDEVFQIVTGMAGESDQTGSLETFNNDQPVAADQGETVQPVTEHETIKDEVMTDHSEVESQDKSELLNEAKLIWDQSESDQVTVSDLGIDHSVAGGPGEVGQSVAGDQTVTDAHSEMDLSLAKAQDEAGLVNKGALISSESSETVQSVTDEAVKDQVVTESNLSVVQNQDQSGLAYEAKLTSVDQRESEQLNVSDFENDHSIAAGQGKTGQSVTEDLNMTGDRLEVDHTVVKSQDKGELISGDQIMVGDTGNDQSVAEGQGETETVKDQVMTDDQLHIDQSVVASQDVTDQRETGLPNECELISGEQSKSGPLMVFDSGKDHPVAAGQGETGHSVVVEDQVMTGEDLEMEHSVVETSGLANTGESDQLTVFNTETEDQGVTGQSEPGDTGVTEQFMVVGQVENDHSAEEVQEETGQIETEGETFQVIQEDQGGSDQLMVDDVSGCYQSLTTDQDVTCHSVTGDQSVPDQFIAVGQVESDQSIVEGKNEAALAETVFPNEAGTSRLILVDQCESDQLMVVDSENDQSLTSGHGGNAAGTSQLVLGDQCAADQLMVVESGNDQLVTATCQSSADQTLFDAFVEVAATQQVVECQSGSGIADEGGICQVVSGSQCDTDQLVANEPRGNDQAVVEGQGGTTIAGTINQSVPDESMDVSQGGSDQIVPGNQSEIDHSIGVDQVGSDQPKPATEYPTAPHSSGQETAAVCLDQPFETPNFTDSCTPASPEDITDHPIAAESVTEQSEVKVEEGTDQVVTLDGIAPTEMFTPYNAVAREELLKELCKIKFFSIVTEEELVVDGQPYIPVAIHYLDTKDTQCKNILALLPLSTNVASFVETLFTALSEKWGLNLALCRSQILTRSGTYASQMTQASALLSQRLPHAFSFPKPIPLKSLLANLSSLRDVTQSFEYLEQLLMWFSEDVQRRVRLEDAVVHLFQKDERKSRELKAMISSNQLALSHEVLELTTDILEAVVLCLNEMKGNQENEANTTQAQSFLSAIQNFDFILTVVIMKNILSLTKNLSLSLRGNSYDVYRAAERLSDLLPSLSEMKNSIESRHETWFQQAVALASKLQVPSLQPPLDVHYKGDVSKGAVEHCISEVKGLCVDAVSALRCLQVVPYVMSKVEGCCKDAEFVRVFQDDLPDPDSFQAELQRWRDRWQDSIAAHQHLPDTVLGTLKVSDIQTFPNISTILRLLAVLPFSGMQSRQGTMNSEMYPL